MNSKERTIVGLWGLLALSGLAGLAWAGSGLGEPLGAGSFAEVAAAHGQLEQFDHQSGKIYRAGREIPEAQLTGEAGTRTLAQFYRLRQYPGSPPVIPHGVAAAFATTDGNCLACHGKGGYSAEHRAFAPVTPHPENSLCFQCHAATTAAKPFVDSTWRSLPPPRLGNSSLGGSPPTSPHGLQLRENCIACHVGPAAVAEIRVTHASRGNCRQCHVVAQPQEVFREFTRQ